MCSLLFVVIMIDGDGKHSESVPDSFLCSERERVTVCDGKGLMETQTLMISQNEWRTATRWIMSGGSRMKWTVR